MRTARTRSLSSSMQPIRSSRGSPARAVSEKVAAGHPAIEAGFAL